MVIVFCGRGVLWSSCSVSPHSVSPYFVSPYSVVVVCDGLPPDVRRRWLCPAAQSKANLWALPLVRACPFGPKAEPGAQPGFYTDPAARHSLASHPAASRGQRFNTTVP